jgi:hypothetical protein
LAARRILLLTFGLPPLFAQMPQNPSPMRDSTRAHQRIPETHPRGERYPLTLGSLFLAGQRRGAIPLVVHFHGDPWLAEESALRCARRVAVLAVNLGAGSGVYRQALTDPARFAQWLTEAAGHLPPGSHFQPVIVTSFSAGYGAVREILRNPANRRGSRLSCLWTAYTQVTFPRTNPAQSIPKVSNRSSTSRARP